MLELETACSVLVLLQVTDEAHPDKTHLVAAVTAMTEVAAAINEFKRRKDLGTFHCFVSSLKCCWSKHWLVIKCICVHPVRTYVKCLLLYCFQLKSAVFSRTFLVCQSPRQFSMLNFLYSSITF